MLRKLTTLFLSLLIVSSCAASSAKLAPRSCPQLQAGYVTGTLSPEGNAILEIVYPCAFDAMPVLVVSPAQSEGTLRVLNFSANSLTGEVGSIQVSGIPGMPVVFSYTATLPTP